MTVSEKDKENLRNAIKLSNIQFMEVLVTIIHIYESLLSDGDIGVLTDKTLSRELLKQDYPVLLEIDPKKEKKDQIYFSGNYRYYANKTCEIKGKKYYYTSQLYGYGDSSTHSDNRTPLWKWVCEKLGVETDTPKEPLEQEGTSMDNKSILNRITKIIRNRGYEYAYDLIGNYYLSLKSKPFVILAGTSGTGKTKLVRLFAEAIGANYKLISVRPDWSDSSDLFGHTNLKGNFVPGTITEYIKKACDDLNHPYFLCLDEMNLARVEYYLSDFLSLIETRAWEDNCIRTEKIDLDESSKPQFEGLYLPENLYVVGTVNMDETTFPFSKKVLDRANTIEFSEVNLLPSFDKNNEVIDKLEIENDFLVSKYLTLLVDTKSEQQPLVEKVCNELNEINEILKKANSHVGYRVRDEIVFYMLNNDEFKVLDYNKALDYEIMQKILPRIQGSTQGIKDLLIELFKKCAGDYSSFSKDCVWMQMNDYLENKSSIYPMSAKKICYMMRRFEEDGFTSYWL